MKAEFAPDFPVLFSTDSQPCKLKVTSSICKAAYGFLRLMPPFSGWRLPEVDRVRFVCNKATMTYGWYEPDPDTITISKAMHTDYVGLLATMAHEMVHLAAERKGLGGHEEHDEQFKHLADQVCTAFGWKPEDF